MRVGHAWPITYVMGGAQRMLTREDDYNQRNMPRTRSACGAPFYISNYLRAPLQWWQLPAMLSMHTLGSRM